VPLPVASVLEEFFTHATATDLRRLDLSGVGVCGDALRPLLARSSHLEDLRLGGHLRGGIGDSVIDECVMPLAPQLRELSLAGCQEVSVRAVVQLCRASATLTALDLSMVRLTAAALRDVLEPPSIRCSLLRLSLCGYTGLPSKSLAHALDVCLALESVDFSASLLKADAFDELCAAEGRGAGEEGRPRLTNLQTARFLDCSDLTCAAIEKLCAATGGSLRHLALGGVFSRLADWTGHAIGLGCGGQAGGRSQLAATPSLTRLELISWKPSAEAMAALLPLASSLEYLDLSDVSGGPDGVSEDALATLLRRYGPGCGARLRVLLLRGCADAVTDSLLAGFLPRAHALERLDVAHCSAITDLSARLISSAASRALRKLRHVDVSHCTRITRRGRALLRLHVPCVSSNDSDNDDE